MDQSAQKLPSPMRATTPEAIRLAKTLMREARFGALAIIEPQSGFPFSSRVAVACAPDGAPLLFISRLSAHTKGLLADSRCSILLGEPGKGDPLAHPRLTLQCLATFPDPESATCRIFRHRYLRRNEKAKLYAGFSDFMFVRLEPQWASLNGGFGQAFGLETRELLDDADAAHAIANTEADAIDHIALKYHQELKSLFSTKGIATTGSMRLTGIDSTGLDLVGARSAKRLWFNTPVTRPLSLDGAVEAITKGI